MEQLAEAYEAVNTGANVEVQTSDSTTGVTSAMEGTCDLGMASRALHDDETGVTATTIANDGIAVIVNNGNPVEGPDLRPDHADLHRRNHRLELSRRLI